MSGPDNVVIHCPFCGASDPSQHMAVSLLGRGWRCLRNPVQHRGRSYVYLLARLLGSTERARELLGVDAPPLPSEDDFAETWRKQLGVQTSQAPRPKTLRLPSEVKPWAFPSKFQGLFWRYLEGRGYTTRQIDWVAQTYDFHFATTGDYAWRIVVPVKDTLGKLMTWTARSIKTNAKVRYKTLPSQEAVKPPGDLLLGLSLLWRATKTRSLIICEGPFDAMTVSVLGHEAGVWGTCLFGVNVSEAQTELLEQLSSRFERVRLLVDPDASLRVLSLRDRLPRQCRVTHLLPGVKDPGDLTKIDGGLDFVQALA